MRVGVDDRGDDGHAGQVHPLRPGGDVHLADRAHRYELSAHGVDGEGAVFNRLSVAQDEAPALVHRDVSDFLDGWCRTSGDQA